MGDASIGIDGIGGIDGIELDGASGGIDGIELDGASGGMDGIELDGASGGAPGGAEPAGTIVGCWRPEVVGGRGWLVDVGRCGMTGATVPIMVLPFVSWLMGCPG
ncbi:MAG TPA: hypothetical protein VHN14_22245 [Kofleriaceae bacterium]|nr:hypothetical protein [Kofleriaceae bacterium]